MGRSTLGKYEVFRRAGRARAKLGGDEAEGRRRRHSLALSLSHTAPPPHPRPREPSPPPKNSVYTDGDGKARRQSLPSLIVALVTLTIYCGWLHIMIGLLLASFFSRWALGTLLLLLATLLLPAKPVLWTGFCASPVFKTWRAYFSYSYLAVREEGRKGGGCALSPAWSVVSLANQNPRPEKTKKKTNRRRISCRRATRRTRPSPSRTSLSSSRTAPSP